jgi:hypothetical protein
MRVSRRSPLARYTSPQSARGLLSLGVGLLALGAGRAASGQGLQTMPTVVRIVAVKPATEATTGAGTLRGWDAVALVPPPVLPHALREVRLAADVSSGVRWYVRGSDGRLSPVTAQWAPADGGPVIRLRAVTTSPSLAADRPRLLLRARTAPGRWTEEVPVDWPSER